MEPHLSSMEFTSMVERLIPHDGAYSFACMREPTCMCWTQTPYLRMALQLCAVFGVRDWPGDREWHMRKRGCRMNWPSHMDHLMRKGWLTGGVGSCGTRAILFKDTKKAACKV